MFEISQNRQVFSDLPVISEAYEVLHFDQIPILFTGLNSYRNRIIGSSVDEDEFAGFERFFHVIARPEEYSRFIRREISYRDLLTDAQSVFVLDRAFDHRFTTVYLIEVSSIPEDYLPSRQSLCPPLSAGEIGLGERYQIILNGRWKFKDLGELPDLYIQVYSAVYAFDEKRPANHDRIETAVQQYPWKGGYSFVNMYTVLQHAVPIEDRPQIAAIQYASPGYLELSLAADVAVHIRQLVDRYLERPRYWKSAYEMYYDYMGGRQLLHGGALIDQTELSTEDIHMLAAGLTVMTDLFGETFIRRVEELAAHPVVSLKIVQSVDRRLSKLARFQREHLASF